MKNRIFQSDNYVMKNGKVVKATIYHELVSKGNGTELFVSKSGIIFDGGKLQNFCVSKGSVQLTAEEIRIGFRKK